MSDDFPTEERRYKVGRVLHSYNLEDLAQDIGTMWTGEAESRYSLRDLADLINRELLRTAMEDAGLDPLDGEVENTYRLLTSDDVDAGTSTQKQRELEREGIDVQALRDDFVTHQAVHTYLKDGLGVTQRQPTPSEQREKDKAAINRLRSKTEAVTTNTISRLNEADVIEIGEFDTFVNIDVFCHECSTQLSVSDLLEKGGCDCRASEA